MKNNFMLLINKSYFQVFLVLLLSYRLKSKSIYIVYFDRPGTFFKLVITIVNGISRNRFILKPIDYFRKRYSNLSDQKSINKMYQILKNFFNENNRLGGQIYIENILRELLWKHTVIDELFEYFYFNQKYNIQRNSSEEIYHIILKLRKIERSLLYRFSVFKSSLFFMISLLKNLLKIKLFYNLKEPRFLDFIELNSISTHCFINNLKYQNHNLIIKAINKMSLDKNFEKVLYGKEFIDYFSLIKSKNISLLEIINLFFTIINLIITFFLSNNFLKNTSNLIDKFTRLYLKKLKFPKKFKILVFDPIDNQYIIPILSEIIQKGHKVYFTSFSIGHFYTKSFADYNGPFSDIFSPHPGLSELARKSNFKGKIIKTKCYLSLTNKELIKNSNICKVNRKKVNIIIPESNPNWFFGLSYHESNLFASLIYSLSLNINVSILIKKKKLNSKLEKYLLINYPSHKIKFSPPLRGSMVDFLNQDFILSHCISSLAIKSAEYFNIPYLIYDPSNNSLNEWNTIFSKSDIKPLFIKNIEELNKILF